MKIKEVFGPDPMLAKILPAVKANPGVNYVPSQYALRFEHRGKRYVSNLLTKQCVEAVLPDSAHAGEDYDELIEAMFLVPEDKDECAFYMSLSAIMRAYQKAEGVRTFTILPTLGCNARCIYCYEEGMKQVTMTPEIVEQTIRYVLDKRHGDSVHLSWFGGEPLLCTGIIDRICEGVREAGVKYESAMVSNASLLTPEVVEKMNGDWHLKHIQVSMDGAEDDYRYRKNYVSYHDYYHGVIDAVSRLSQAGITVTVRCNVDEDNWERIPQYIKDMKNGVTDKEHVRMYFAPLYAVQISENDLHMWEKILSASQMIRDAGFKCVSNVGSGGQFRVTHCMADAGNVVITPDGGLYACEHCPPEGRFGDVFSGVTDPTPRDTFCRADLVRDKCRKCPYLPLCTAFSSCPVQDKYCREVYELQELDSLKERIDRGVDKAETNAGGKPAC